MRAVSYIVHLPVAGEPCSLEPLGPPDTHRQQASFQVRNSMQVMELALAANRFTWIWSTGAPRKQRLTHMWVDAEASRLTARR